jgi:hypothetical protein
MVDGIDRVLEHASTVVIGNKDPDFQTIPARLTDGQCVVDLVRVAGSSNNSAAYDYIC